MRVSEFIEKLSEIPGDWRVVSTRSVQVEQDPGYGEYLKVGQQYGYVFTDERPNRICVKRS